MLSFIQPISELIGGSVSIQRPSSVMFQENIWVGNFRETGFAVVKGEASVTLPGPGAAVYLDVFMFPFQREPSFCVFEGSFLLQNCCLIATVLCFCEISPWQFRSNESRS